MVESEQDEEQFSLPHHMESALNAASNAVVAYRLGSRLLCASLDGEEDRWTSSEGHQSKPNVDPLDEVQVCMAPLCLNVATATDEDLLQMVASADLRSYVTQIAEIIGDQSGFTAQSEACRLFRATVDILKDPVTLAAVYQICNALVEKKELDGRDMEAIIQSAKPIDDAG
jgi:hypothetical protein